MNIKMYLSLSLLMTAGYARCATNDRGIMQAAFTLDVPKLRAILDQDPSKLYATDRHGQIPIHKALISSFGTSCWNTNETKKLETLACLMSYCRPGTEQAYVNRPDKDGFTTLHMTALQPGTYCRFLKFVLAYGADKSMNAKTHHGNTPLHLAKDSRVAHILLARGADATIRNNTGDTPYAYCSSREDCPFLTNLLQSALVQQQIKLIQKQIATRTTHTATPQALALQPCNRSRTQRVVSTPSQHKKLRLQLLKSDA